MVLKALNFGNILCGTSYLWAEEEAKCICILVASQALFEPECHSIEQMKLANALCRYREMAREVEV